MARLTIRARMKRTGSDGRIPLRLEISHRSERRFVGLEVRVRPSDWSESRRRVKARAKDAAEVNQYLSEVEAKAESALIELQAQGAVTPDALRDAVERALSGDARSPDEAEERDLLDFMDGWIRTMEREGRARSASKWRVVYNKLRAWAATELGRGPATPRPLKSLSPGEIRQWAAWMQAPKSEGGRGNSLNTAAVALRILRTCLNAAVREGLLDKNPANQIVIRERPVERERLSLEEIGQLAAVETRTPLEREVLDVFLFQVYAGGMRFSDALETRWSNVGETHLSYQMAKTGKIKRLPIIAALAEILNRYEDRRGARAWVFPMLDRYTDAEGTYESAYRRMKALDSRNTIANKYLAKLTERAGLGKHVTTHVARHSYANIALDAGWDVAAISQALGHSSLKVTESYLKGLRQDRMDELHAGLFGSVGAESIDAE